MKKVGAVLFEIIIEGYLATQPIVVAQKYGISVRSRRDSQDATVLIPRVSCRVGWGDYL